MNKRAALTSLTLGFLLAACGGGGDSPAPAPAPAPAPPAVTTLTGSAGDFGRYANANWAGECGTSVTGLSAPFGATARSVTNVFRFGPAASTSVDGTLTTTAYGQLFCSGDRLPSGFPQSSIRLVYLSQVAVTSEAVPTAQGTADLVVLHDRSTGATQTLTIAFLPGFRQFQTGGPNAFFSSSSVTYSKP